MARYYYAAFIPSATGYAILVPDFPEIASQGGTVEECMEMATDAVAGVVEAYASARKPLPDPSDMEQARRMITAELHALDEAMPDSSLFQLVQAPSVDLTPVKISISVPKSTLTVIDQKAHQLGMTRSGFLVQAAQAYN